MIVHVYALTWNEHDLLPLFFKNYSYASKFYFLDYNSNPIDQVMMKQDPRAEIVSLPIKELDDDYIANLKNTVWKQSREADWVVVQDFDEFAYHPDMLALLERLKNEGCTVIQCEGWDVVRREIPTSMEGLRGVRYPHNDKMLIFNPKAINNMNYVIGAHGAKPEGTVKINTHTVKLMHMKMACGLDYFLWRRASSAKKLSTNNRVHKWGCECLRPLKVQITEFEDAEKKAVGIS